MKTIEEQIEELQQKVAALEKTNEKVAKQLQEIRDVIDALHPRH